MPLASKLAALGLFVLVATGCAMVPSTPEAVSPDKPAPQENAPREPEAVLLRAPGVGD